MSIINWINLTNGLQAIHDYGLTKYSIMRLQSTYCEQKRWNDILTSIPDEFLLQLALGNECRVYDYGARKAVPRAIWQGLEWVRYVITRRWTDSIIKPTGRAKHMGKYFDEQYNKLNKREKARLDYFGSMSHKTPLISSITSSTIHDGNKKLLWECAK